MNNVNNLKDLDSPEYTSKEMYHDLVEFEKDRKIKFGQKEREVIIGSISAIKGAYLPLSVYFTNDDQEVKDLYTEVVNTLLQEKLRFIMDDVKNNRASDLELDIEDMLYIYLFGYDDTCNMDTNLEGDDEEVFRKFVLYEFYYLKHGLLRKYYGEDTNKKYNTLENLDIFATGYVDRAIKSINEYNDMQEYGSEENSPLDDAIHTLVYLYGRCDDLLSELTGKDKKDDKPADDK